MIEIEPISTTHELNVMNARIASNTGLDFSEFYLKKNSDFTFICGEPHFYAHRYLLALKSPVLINTEISQLNSIQMNGCEVEALLMTE
jgi:hypothetical protein